MTIEASASGPISAKPAVAPDTVAWAAYPRSWVNAVIDRIERLPGPAWVAYLVAVVPSVLLVASQDWLSGGQVGRIEPLLAVWGVAMVGVVWLIHHLDHVSRTALRAFAPMLDVAPAAMARLEYEMTVIPRRPALALLTLSAVRMAEAFVFQPESEGLVGLSPVALAIRGTFEVVFLGLVFVLLYHTVRQLRLVGRIHDSAPRVNLFRPAPLYAFSRLTSRTAIGLAMLLIPFGGVIAASVSALDYAMSLILTAAILGIALASFALPLLGMHGRMDAEKKRLQAEVGQRIESMIGELHGSVDRRDLGGADGQNKTLASLIAERDLVQPLSTWPWQAGTAGAVLSAVFLPIGLWLVTRVLAEVF